MSERIDNLKKAVELAAECTAHHARSELVVETFQGQTVWEGMVEVFALVGHREAKRTYAWTYPDGDQTRFATVLEIPPVDSPQSAVKVAIASTGRQNIS